MIISISGFINSGEDSIAAYLIENYYFEKESWAGSLKDMVAAIFGWDRELLEGSSRISREWRETIDPWWAERLGIPHLTPRWVLQHIGTDVLRTHFHDDIWLYSLENKLQAKEKHVVITDTRFPNELSMVRKQKDSLIIRVKRGNDPDWFSIATEANNLKSQSAIDELKRLGIHPSEYSWAGYEFDITLDNNGSLEELFAKVDDIMWQ